MGSEVWRMIKRKRTYRDHLGGHWEEENRALKLVWMEMETVAGEEGEVDRSSGYHGLSRGACARAGGNCWGWGWIGSCAGTSSLPYHDSKDCDDKLDELKGVGDGSRLASSGACCTTGCVVRLCCGYNGLNHGFLQSTSLWAFKCTLSRSPKFMTFPSVGSLSSIESQIKSILCSRLSVVV